MGDLLVAPVLELGASTWEVYLPTGSWVNAWTGEQTSGGRAVEASAPIGEIPVFGRAEASWPRDIFRRST